MYLQSTMDVDSIIETGVAHVAFATGASWRRDGMGLNSPAPLEFSGQQDRVFTPDDIMDGRLPVEPTVVYDDEHYYRIPDQSLCNDLNKAVASGLARTIQSVTCIGDCEAPGIIAGAVFSGHRYARELEQPVDPDRPFKFDRVFFEN